MLVTTDPRIAATHLNKVAEATVRGAMIGLKRAGEVIRGDAIKIIRAPYPAGRLATGQLAQSISVIELPPQGPVLMAAVIAADPKSPFVEMDTRPHWAPRSPFEAWARTKVARGAPGPPERLAAAAWISVAKRGTTGIHFFARSFARNRAQIPRIVREAIARELKPLAS